MTTNRTRQSTLFFSTSLALSFGLLFPAYAQPFKCETPQGIRQMEERLSAKFEELTKAQIAQTEDMREALRARGRERGWSEERWTGVIAEYLSSPSYQALELQRAPYTKTMNEFKLAGRNAKTTIEIRNVCLKASEAMAAGDAAFKINTSQSDLARAFFSVAD